MIWKLKLQLLKGNSRLLAFVLKLLYFMLYNSPERRALLWAVIQRMSEEQDNNIEPTELLARVMKLDRWQFRSESLWR